MGSMRLLKVAIGLLLLLFFGSFEVHCAYATNASEWTTTTVANATTRLSPVLDSASEAEWTRTIANASTTNATATTTTSTSIQTTTTALAQNTTFTVYVATLRPLDNSSVSGEVTVFASSSGLMAIGSATGLEANLIAAPEGSNCTQPNGCGAHIHAGIACVSSITQGGHYFVTAPDPWTPVKYGRTDATGSSSFRFSLATDAVEINGKPFILHDSSGKRVSCGILSRQTHVHSARLTPLRNSVVFGSVAILEKSPIIVGAGWARGLEANLLDSSNGGANCSATNGCGVHVHNGSDCGSSIGQGGHLLSASGDDPWTNIRYHRTDEAGFASFLFHVELESADVTGRVFIVHDNSGARVSCGRLSLPAALHTTTTTTPRTRFMGFSGFPAYACKLSELGGSGVYGDIAIFVTSTGLLGAGSASGLQPNLAAAPAGANCTKANACGVHVHSGIACTNGSAQGGHYFAGTSDPWASVRYTSTDLAGETAFSFSVTTTSTAIEGKPFIVHNDAGARVACGILSFVKSTQSAQLSPLNNSGVMGGVTLHTTASLIIGAGWASGLERNLTSPSQGGTDCTKTNACGAHVHSGSSCNSTAGQGGHLTTAAGLDPWTSIGYSSTSSSGVASFTFAIKSDNTLISGKPFVVHNNAGDRVSCGILLSTSSVFSANLEQLGRSGVSGKVTIIVTPNGLIGVGSAQGLEPRLVGSSDCNAPNGCGVHLHSGIACTTSTTQGGHFYTTSSDPWLAVGYSRTDSVGIASFTFSVATGSTEINGKPFIVHDSAGVRVACGILSPSSVSRSQDLDRQSVPPDSGSNVLGVLGLVLGIGAAMFTMLSCLCWYRSRRNRKSMDGTYETSAEIESPPRPARGFRSLASRIQGDVANTKQSSSSELPTPADEEVKDSSEPNVSSYTNQPEPFTFRNTNQPEPFTFRKMSFHSHEEPSSASQSESLQTYRQREDLKSATENTINFEGAFEV